jgi:hypothetical protein
MSGSDDSPSRTGPRSPIMHLVQTMRNDASLRVQPCKCLQRAAHDGTDDGPTAPRRPLAVVTKPLCRNAARARSETIGRRVEVLVHTCARNPRQNTSRPETRSAEYRYPQRPSRSEPRHVNRGRVPGVNRAMARQHSRTCVRWRGLKRGGGSPRASRMRCAQRGIGFRR